MAADLHWLDVVCASAIRKPSQQSIDEWLKANVSLDSTSPIQGPYDVANSPQLREPLLAFQDDSVRMVTTVGPNQGGRTKAMEGASLWAICNRPGPMQWNSYKDENAREFAEQRWWPAAKSCEPVVAKLPAGGSGRGQSRHKERIRSVIFNDGMPFKIQGCAISNLEEKSIMTQFNDECYQWPMGRMEIAHVRCNVAYAWNYHVWNGSVAGIAGDDLEKFFLQGTQHEWHWRCLNCGKAHLPKWGKRHQRGGIQWEEDSKTRPNKREWDADEAAKTVRYSCEFCNADYADTSQVRRALNDTGHYQQLNARASDEMRSYRFNILSVAWPGVTWGKWVKEFLGAVEQHRMYANVQPLKLFWTRRMAEFWDDSKHLAGNRRTIKADYSIGLPNIYSKSQWEGESIRFAGVDKQEWGYPYVIRACKPTGESRLIARGVSESDCLSSYDEIEAKANEFGLASQCVLMDSGFESREVYAQAAKHGWTCMRGVDREELFKHVKEVIDPATRVTTKITIELPYSDAKWADPFMGTHEQQLNRRLRRFAATPQLARRFDWINLHIKNMLSAFKQGRALYWGIADDAGAEYYRQINAETRHFVITPRGRRIDWWSNTNAEGTGTKRPNHAWDCECMILVAMCQQCLIDLSDWSPESIAGDTRLPSALETTLAPLQARN